MLMKTSRMLILVLGICIAGPGSIDLRASDLRRLPYNHEGLIVDLGVGLWAWPLPMDYDGDGDKDLLVSCPDVPYNGTYLFENPGGDAKMPVFKPAVRIGPGLDDITVSDPQGRPQVLTPGRELTAVLDGDLRTGRRIYSRSKLMGGRIRANQWSYVDYDGDEALDLLLGHGVWDDYGWDDAYNEQGEWTRGPLHGYVYLIRNTATTAEPDYAEPKRLTTVEGHPVDVFGMPSPNLADFDDDGDLDLLCGEFLDGFTYYENVGTRAMPQFASGRRLTRDGEELTMDLCMIVVSALDWDEDGDPDLVVGQEDGRVALIEHTGRLTQGMPVFERPKFFRQQAEHVKFGALVTPVSVDWDGDGDEDLIAGNTAGYIGFLENLGDVTGSDTPKWAAPVRLKAGGQTIRIMAGPNGSIQGPAEAKWGYTTLDVADWDHDGRPDLVANSIWGKVHWYRNIGTRRQPKLAPAAPIKVQWEGQPPKPAWNWWAPEDDTLVTQWRTKPLVCDWNGDGLRDLIMLDHEGYLALFRRKSLHGDLVLLPGERVFRDDEGNLLRLNDGSAGRSGRRKLCLVDWDGDGRRDLIVNSRNADLYRNVSRGDGPPWRFRHEGPLAQRRLAGHTTSPTTVDFNGDGWPDLLLGAEDGYLYHMTNPNP